MTDCVHCFNCQVTAALVQHKTIATYFGHKYFSKGFFFQCQVNSNNRYNFNMTVRAATLQLSSAGHKMKA